MDTQTLPTELKRAMAITDKLYKAIGLAKKFKLQKLNFDIADAEELVEILNNSFSSLQKYEGLELHDFDNTLPVPSTEPSQPKRVTKYSWNTDHVGGYLQGP